MSTRQQSCINAEQHRALQQPVVLPSPQRLFDQIVETLVAKGLAKYDDTGPFRKDLPTGLYLLIPRQPAELDLYHLMHLIEVDGEKGQNYLDPQDLTDTVAVPEGAYLMTDIEDGKGRLNTKLSVSEKNILAEHRSPYTAFEGIIHGIVFPELLTSHSVNLCGSRHKSRGVPRLCLAGGRPELFADSNDGAFPKWGAPSCGGRVSVRG